MANVLTIGSDVTCGHKGTVSKTSTAKLKINGRSALLKSSIENRIINGCTTERTNSTNPCERVLSVEGTSEARKLTVQGRRVLLDSLKGSTDGVPLGLLAVDAKQDKLTASVLAAQES